MEWQPMRTEAMVGVASALTVELYTMTDDNARAWAAMGISKDWQIKRLTDWANMLERRLAQLDPTYMVHPFGRIVVDEFVPDAELRFEQNGRIVGRITNVDA